MGWSVGYDSNWQRDIGYGVPAYCDHPECRRVIDRGLAYVCCDQEPHGGDKGCGLYFCQKHASGFAHKCERCKARRKPFDAKQDHPKWIRHKLRHSSWKQWRDQNPDEVKKLQAVLLERLQKAGKL